VEPSGVIIISSHPLFAEALVHLLKEKGIGHVSTVDSVPTALPLLKQQAVETIIVDYDDAQLGDAEIVSQLVGSDEARQLIFLTLAGNQMVVHHRERVENVTPDDLIQALHFSGAE
jgi:DNA-binding NarL/FixJ family response regulator